MVTMLRIHPALAIDLGKKWLKNIRKNILPCIYKSHSVHQSIQKLGLLISPLHSVHPRGENVTTLCRYFEQLFLKSAISPNKKTFFKHTRTSIVHVNHFLLLLRKKHKLNAVLRNEIAPRKGKGEKERESSSTSRLRKKPTSDFQRSLTRPSHRLYR